VRAALLAEQEARAQDGCISAGIECLAHTRLVNDPAGRQNRDPDGSSNALDQVE
jgi:hypothetical protein